MSRTEYSDEFKAEALAALDANGGNVAGTARELDIPRSTLKSWANNRGVHPEVAKLRQGKKGDLANRLEDIAWTLADHIDSKEKIKSATISQMTTAFGTVVDKMRLLRGEATEINENRNTDDLRDNIQRKLLSGTTSNGTRAEA